MFYTIAKVMKNDIKELGKKADEYLQKQEGE